jgi:hypothetical protein
MSHGLSNAVGASNAKRLKATVRVLNQGPLAYRSLEKCEAKTETTLEKLETKAGFTILP